MLLAGPGIFGVGYTIGTGAVTKLGAAGVHSGWRLAWVLPLGGLLFWALAEAYGRFTVITGDTALHGFRTQLRAGKWLALFILLGATVAQLSGLPVLAGLVAQLSYDGLRLAMPGLPVLNPAAVLGCAALLGAGAYAVIHTGRYAVWEKTMVVASLLMLAGFLGAAGILYFAPPGLAVLPVQPVADDGGWMTLMALAGTAVAAPTFVVRALLMKGKEWSGPASPQARDALIAAVGLVVLILAIVACGAAVGGGYGSVRGLFDLAPMIEARGGRLAAGLFLMGAVGAGVTSFIPMAMVLPLLLADFRGMGWQVRTLSFRVWGGLACLAGAAGPLLSECLLPLHRFAGQVAQVVVLPLAVGGIFLLVNRRDLMRGREAGPWLNTGLAVAFAFSLVLSGLGLVALGRRFA